MTTSTAFKTGVWILRALAGLSGAAVLSIASVLPIPSLTQLKSSEKKPFTQIRHGVEKQIVSTTDTQKIVTTLTSPFSLLHSGSAGIVETLYDVRGISVEGNEETRFFSTQEARFVTSERSLTAEKMSIIFEKGVKKTPEAPYYSGIGTHFCLNFRENSPQIYAESIDGVGTIPIRAKSEESDAS